MHKNFYRDQYRRMVFMTGFLLLTNICCILIIIFLLLEHPSDVLIPAEEVSAPAKNISVSNLAITPRIPTNRPNMKKIELTQWVLDTIRSSFTYGLQTYKKHLNTNKAYYTNTGWDQYKTILNNMVRFDTLTTKETLISVVHPMQAPTIYNQGLVNGVYTWIYDFPIKVQFSGSVPTPAQSMMLRITVIRTSMENDVDGIKISGMQARDIQRRSGPATTPGVIN